MKQRIRRVRIRFRNLAFELQVANEERKAEIILEMIEILNEETDKIEAAEMRRTIIANSELEETDFKQDDVA